MVFFAGTGADALTVGELRGSDVGTLELSLGTQETVVGTIEVTETQGTGSNAGTVTRTVPRVTTVDDNAADRVIVLGSGLADEYTLNTEAPDVDTGFYRKVRASRRVAGQSTYSYELIVGGSLRIEGDVLRFETGDGADRIDAASLGAVQTVQVGSPAQTLTIRGRDLIALELVTGAGNDTIVGSPFADLLEGGTGSDRYTGGDGLDRFVDTSTAPTDIDVLVEQFDRDMGLFDNTFIVGNVLADGGGPFGLTPPVTQAYLEAEFKVDDPDLRFGSRGDRWTAASVVEDLRFIFEEAELLGGEGRNVMVVGDADGFVTVGATARQVAPWTGPGDPRQRRQHRQHVPRVLRAHASSAGTARGSASGTPPAPTCSSCSAPTAPTASGSTPRAAAPTAPGSSPSERSAPTARTVATRSSTAASSWCRSTCSAAPTPCSPTTRP